MFCALVCRCRCPCYTLTSALCCATERCIPLQVKQAQSACYSFGIWFRVLSASKLAGCKSYNFNRVGKIAKSNSFVLIQTAVRFLYHKQTKMCRPVRHFKVTYRRATCLVYHEASSCTSVIRTALMRYSTTAPKHYGTTTIKHYNTTLQHYSTTELQNQSTTAIKHYSTTALKHYSTTELQHQTLQHYSTKHYRTKALKRYSTTALQYNTTVLQHYSSTALQHYITTVLQYNTTALKH